MGIEEEINGGKGRSFKQDQESKGTGEWNRISLSREREIEEESLFTLKKQKTIERERC